MATTNPPTDPTPITHVALVGHCGFDGAALKRLAEQTLPQAQVVAVNTQAQLDEHTKPTSLLLINRVLDGRFDTDSSLEMMKHLAARDHAPPMLLISNYEQAQADAVAAGARPGFGKSEMGSPTAEKKIFDAAGL